MVKIAIFLRFERFYKTRGPKVLFFCGGGGGGWAKVHLNQNFMMKFLFENINNLLKCIYLENQS